MSDSGGEDDAARVPSVDVTPALEHFATQLSREPDFDAPELQAYDAADLLILRQAAELFTAQSPAGGPDVAAAAGAAAAAGPAPALPRIAVLGDHHGALTLGAAAVLAPALGFRVGHGAPVIRVHQDPLLGERALDANAARLDFSDSYERHPLGEDLLRDATLVLVQLPRSLAELDELAWHIARFADPAVTVLAGGRDKHMSRGMNEVLARYFGQVQAGRGWRKARVLTARSPLAASDIGPAPFPVRERDAALGFDLHAYGATFGGAKLDHGSRLLLQTLREGAPHPAAPRRVVDLGCGNGVLAVSAALAWPEARVIATDQSAAAVAATLVTAERAGVEAVRRSAGANVGLDADADADAAAAAPRLVVFRADATEAVPDGWAELLLLNPPFHTGSTVHAGVAHRLIRSCARALARGGELRLVFNSHLAYRALVEREIGPTRQLARDKTFTVLAATRR